MIVGVGGQGSLLAKGDYIRERVQIAADGGMGVQQPCCKAIEKVEEAGNENHKGRLDGHTGTHEQNGKAT